MQMQQQQEVQPIRILDSEGNEITNPDILAEMITLDSGGIEDN